jgi:phosphatidylinositol alpha-mannosyltransferase
MKIGIVGENYFPTVGGIQEHIYNQAIFLRNAGHDVRVITGVKRVPRWVGPQDEDWVIRVGESVRFGTMGTYTDFTIGPRVAARMRRLFADEHFDLVHVHGPNDFGLPLLTYLYYKGPIVATLHSAFKHGPGRSLAAPWYKWVMRRTDAVIAVSPLAAATMGRYARFDSIVIPNGVDVAEFARGQRMKAFDDGRKNVVYLGRLEPRNGPDLLLAALPAVAAAHPDARFILGGSGPMDQSLHQQVPETLRDRVVFLGLVDNDKRADLYATADAFVIPARFGGTFSIMVLEALAAGAPIVATPFVDPHHRDSHWDPVRPTRDYSPAAIAEGLIEVLSHDQSERVASGRKIVINYDWPHVGARILEVYRGLPGIRPLLATTADSPNVSP